MAGLSSKEILAQQQAEKKSADDKLIQSEVSEFKKRVAPEDRLNALRQELLDSAVDSVIYVKMVAKGDVTADYARNSICLGVLDRVGICRTKSPDAIEVARKAPSSKEYDAELMRAIKAAQDAPPIPIVRTEDD